MRTEQEIKSMIEHWKDYADTTPPSDKHSEGYYIGLLHALEWVLGRSPESTRSEIK